MSQLCLIVRPSLPSSMENQDQRICLCFVVIIRERDAIRQRTIAICIFLFLISRLRLGLLGQTKGNHKQERKNKKIS